MCYIIRVESKQKQRKGEKKNEKKFELQRTLWGWATSSEEFHDIATRVGVKPTHVPELGTFISYSHEGARAVMESIHNQESPHGVGEVLTLCAEVLE